jgi:hypothetical protein
MPDTPAYLIPVITEKEFLIKMSGDYSLFPSDELFPDDGLYPDTSFANFGATLVVPQGSWSYIPPA